MRAGKQACFRTESHFPPAIPNPRALPTAQEPEKLPPLSADLSYPTPVRTSEMGFKVLMETVQGSFDQADLGQTIRDRCVLRPGF